MRIRDKCAVFGAYSENHQAAEMAYYGLLALQHRGQESAGIATYDNGIRLKKEMGLVTDVFSDRALKELNGTTSIGHVRYSTTGESKLENAQPVHIQTKHGELVIAHNGNIVSPSYKRLRSKLEQLGCKFRGTTDTEAIAYAIIMHRAETGDIVEAVIETMEELEGSYSITLLTDEGELIIFRDPLGFRPLCFGERDGTFVAASESVAFDVVEADFLGDVKPGEVIRIEGGDVERKQAVSYGKTAHCMFEYVYFSRPDSIINNLAVYDARIGIGEQLAKEHPVDADIVVPIPDSARPHAVGFANFSGIPVVEGLIKSRFIGRTFIMPSQKQRDRLVRLKLNPVRSVLENQRVVLLDDSIVRGTTSCKIINAIKKAGAKEVHVRIGCPPIKSPCFYGIDMPTKAELIASCRTVPLIAKEIDADSLGYLSIEGLMNALKLNENNLCLACLTGRYPTKSGEMLAQIA